MDLPTWIFSLTTLVLINFILYSTRCKTTAEWLALPIDYVILIGTLLNQGVSVPGKIGNKRKLIFGLWILGAIVIGNGYSGLIVSLMMKSIPPEYPMSFGELVNFTEYTIVTTGVTKLQIPNFEIVDVPTILNSSGWRPKKYDNILSRIHFVHYDVIELKEQPFGTDVVNGNPIESASGPVKISSHFALVELGARPEGQARVIQEILRGEKLIIPSVHILEIFNIHVVAVSSNYFYRLVQPTYRGLRESGIYEKWVETNCAHLKLYTQMYLSNKTKSKYKYQMVAPILFNLPEPAEEPEPGDMETLKVPLLAYTILIGFACIVWQIEFSHRLVDLSGVFELLQNSWAKAYKLMESGIIEIWDALACLKRLATLFIDRFLQLFERKSTIVEAM